MRYTLQFLFSTESLAKHKLSSGNVVFPATTAGTIKATVPAHSWLVLIFKDIISILKPLSCKDQMIYFFFSFYVTNIELFNHFFFFFKPRCSHKRPCYTGTNCVTFVISFYMEITFMFNFLCCAVCAFFLTQTEHMHSPYSICSFSTFKTALEWRASVPAKALHACII